MKNHPHLAELYTIYKVESQPFRKVHRMIDLFESIIKTHTVVILGEYFKQNKYSNAAKGLLATGLRTPSLGTWQLFSRVLYKELAAENHVFFQVDFAKEFEKLDKDLDNQKTNVISFRNEYAHGATPSDELCSEDIKRFEPFLESLLASKWLADSTLLELEGKVSISNSSTADVISLYPILLYKPEPNAQPYVFFNDLKNDKIGLLNYPLSKHYREKDFYAEFHEHLPLHEWKKTGNNEFYQRIEELTETFKGRTIEREKLLQFVLHNHKGYFSIQGNPGIGKSALIAQFFKDLRSHTEAKQLKVIEYFIRRGTQQAQVEYMFNYLIRRTDEVFPAGKEIRAEGKMVFDLQYQLFAKWRLWSEQANGQQLLFLIDGLDEGVENNVVTYLPRENFDNILIIYGSRPGGHKTIDDLWATLPVENHSKLELSGLGKEDIRALIYEVANKYEVERESAWIDAVQKRSQGNPLYLKLLCDAIENGSIELNDINALPEKIDEYYKAILQRYAQDIVDGDALLTGLFTFAAAKDYLTMAHLGLINKLGSASVQRIGSTLKEVLYENPLTEEVLDYQLFHESFREYLVVHKSKEIQEATERLIDFCSTWNELSGTWEQRYALEHYATHLAESKKANRSTQLVVLAEDTDYTQTQKHVLKHFAATQKLFRFVLEQANSTKDYDTQLDVALHLVDLQYEEQNDAPQVVALVATGDTEDLALALKRIESFGGADAEGIKRKFILYMLCLMELTLLNSKEKPFSKSAIEKLLNHLDEQIPTDTSLVIWDKFFPSFLMFLMACEWANLGLDYLIVYKRTDDWQTDWLKEKGPYSDAQFQLLLECARGIRHEYSKSNALANITIELVQQGKVEEALECTRDISNVTVKKSRAFSAISCELAKLGQFEDAFESARDISDEFYKSRALQSISCELFQKGQLEEATTAIQEAFACARGISDEYDKCYALGFISGELAIKGQLEEAASSIQEALEFARGISDEYVKSRALQSISTELAKQGQPEEALDCARGISDEYCKSRALQSISTELAKQGQPEEALDCARGISDEYCKSRALKSISSELAKRGQIKEAASVVQEALYCARGISDYYKCHALGFISGELAIQGQLEEAASSIQEALEFARDIRYENAKSSALGSISFELAKQGQLEEALACARGISDEYGKSRALRSISSELAKQGQLEEAVTSMQVTLAFARGMIHQDNWNSALHYISSKLAKQRKVDEALACARGITDEFSKSSALLELLQQVQFEDAASLMQECLTFARCISDEENKYYALQSIFSELFQQGQLEEAADVMQEALICARGISNEYSKIPALQSISGELAKRGKLEEASYAIKEALTYARGISGKENKSRALKSISVELAKQGQFEEALDCARGISNENDNSDALGSISSELAKQGQVEEAASAMQEALACASGIRHEYSKSSALESISVELVKQGKSEEAIVYAQGISIERVKSSALSAISGELVLQGKLEEALTCARGISDEYYKCDALGFISGELAKQGNWQLAESIGLEILLLNKRHDCWKNLGWNSYEDDGWQKALEQINQLKNEEARLFYLKGWAENVSVCDATPALITEALPFLVNDAYSIEIILYEHALHEVVFNAVAIEKIKQLNSTLNIQWFLDIYNSMPQPPAAKRLSTNLDTWLHEIEDEDDQDQITLWAKQVAKGKITEEEFQTRIKDI